MIKKALFPGLFILLNICISGGTLHAVAAVPRNGANTNNGVQAIPRETPYVAPAKNCDSFKSYFLNGWDGCPTYGYNYGYSDYYYGGYGYNNYYGGPAYTNGYSYYYPSTYVSPSNYPATSGYHNTNSYNNSWTNSAPATGSYSASNSYNNNWAGAAPATTYSANNSYTQYWNNTAPTGTYHPPIAPQAGLPTLR
jgi:hypothetical protein